MNDKINFIRQKCIEVNPHREEGWDWDSGRPTGSGYMDHAPCRLADVLLAMPDEITRGTTAFANVGDCLYTTDQKSYKSIKLWRLHDDDLEKQSEETINFLYELLK